MHRVVYLVIAAMAAVAAAVGYRWYRHVDLVFPAFVVCSGAGVAAVVAQAIPALEIALLGVMAVSAWLGLALMRRDRPR